MIRTRITELLGIDHPIISAPMGTAAGAELAAAVSEAGGLGLIGTGGAGTPDWLREQIRTVREYTNRPFGVGFISSYPSLDSLVEVALEERVPVIAHSFADPTPYVAAAHAASIKVLAQVQKLSHANIVALAGVDIIVAQGTEAGGHGGHHSTLPMVAAVLDVAGEIPVVAAGGIADGRGLAAALMMGAEGAWVGSRFVASRESTSKDYEKERIVEASIDDTMNTKAFDLAMGSSFPLDVGHRVLRNDFATEWHARDSEVLAKSEELRAQVSAAVAARDVSIAPVSVGDAVSLILSIEPAGDIVRRMVEEAEAILRSRPQSLFVD